MPVAPKAVIASPSDDEPAAGARGIALDRVLREPAEFERCLARPALVRSGPFALHLARRPEVDVDDASRAWRLGLVISKRHEPSAVARNTIKRRWRAAFRRGCDAWAREFGAADVVVRMQAPLIAKSKAAASAAVPARVRARDRFDPQTLFDALAAKLRGRRDGVARSADRSLAALPAASA